jgi:hypothetical protein
MKDYIANPPKELIKAFDSDNCALYVGAGLSQGAKLPSWGNLLTELIDKVEEETSTSAEKIKECRELAKNPARYLLLAEELKEILQDDLYSFIKQKFDDKSIKPTEAHKVMLKLNYKFIITTNYDTLIEKTFNEIGIDVPIILSYKQAPTINYNVYNGEKFILKAHGDARSAPEEIILTEKDYRNIMHTQRGYQAVLQGLFSLNTVLFLGASLNDPELILLLNFIHNIFHGGTPNHYALIPSDQITQTEIERWRKDFRIKIIPYDPANNHKWVVDFLESLSNKTKRNPLLNANP